MNCFPSLLSDCFSIVFRLFFVFSRVPCISVLPGLRTQCFQALLCSCRSEQATLSSISSEAPKALHCHALPYTTPSSLSSEAAAARKALYCHNHSSVRNTLGPFKRRRCGTKNYSLPQALPYTTLSSLSSEVAAARKTLHCHKLFRTEHRLAERSVMLSGSQQTTTFLSQYIVLW